MISCAAVYHPEIPAFMKPYLETDAMKRLKNVDMNCGMNYTSCARFLHIEPYSRFHHSLGCALIAWHFTQRKEQALAALFHDIAAPAFSHVIDFVHRDYLNQETTENRTAWIISHDEGIMNLLHRDGIALSEVNDYHRYPLCDNDSPRLCADRLEYICGDLIDYRMCSYDEVKMIYADLSVTKNEEGADELCFREKNTAALFSHYALECGKIYSGDENRYAMEMLAGIIRRAMRTGILCEEDLYSGEDAVMARLLAGSLSEEVIRFTSLCGVKRADESEEGVLTIDAKKRYVDPLVKNRGRISALDDGIRNDMDMFLSISYDYPLKGVCI